MHCRTEPYDWDERINPNVVDSAGLWGALGDSVVVASLLDWTDADTIPRTAGAEAGWYAQRGRAAPRNGPFADVAELARVRGLEVTSPTDLRTLFTVRGDGSVSPDRADAAVLRTIRVFGAADAERLVRAARAGRRFSNARDVVDYLGLDLDVDGFRRLATRLSFSGETRTVRAVGWASPFGRQIEFEIVTTVVPVDGRLALTELVAR